MLGRTR